MGVKRDLDGPLLFPASTATTANPPAIATARSPHLYVVMAAFRMSATARAPARSAAAASPMKTIPTSTSSVLRALAAILALLYVPVITETTTTLLSGGLLILMTLTYCVLGWELPCDVAMLCILMMVRAGLPPHALAWLLEIMMLAKMFVVMAGWHRSM
jgi:hypothetical protein